MRFNPCCVELWFLSFSLVSSILLYEYINVQSELSTVDGHLGCFLGCCKWPGNELYWTYLPWCCTCTFLSIIYTKEWNCLDIRHAHIYRIFWKILFIFRERGGEGKRHQLVTSCTPLTRDLTCNPGMCPDRESNPQPFTLWDSTEPTESHLSGLYLQF